MMSVLPCSKVHEPRYSLYACNTIVCDSLSRVAGHCQALVRCIISSNDLIGGTQRTVNAGVRLTRNDLLWKEPVADSAVERKKGSIRL
jgi:hypothetical protein